MKLYPHGSIPKARRMALALVLLSSALTACGGDDGGTGPAVPAAPADLTIRVSQAIVFGTCEGSSGLDGTGDFIYEMQLTCPDSALQTTPVLPVGQLVQGDTGEIVPLDLEFVVDGAATEVAWLQIQFEVSERDGAGVYDSRMRGSRGEVVLRPDADGSWDGISTIVSVYGGSPCRIDFVIEVEQ
jgi:hypothetical protein